MNNDITLTDVMVSLAPNSAWVVRDMRDIEWLDDSCECPSAEQIDKEFARLRKEKKDSEYRLLRSQEYPDLSEFADAFYWLRNGDEGPMLDYEARVSEVKAKYPKPKRTRKKAEQ